MGQTNGQKKNMGQTKNSYPDPSNPTPIGSTSTNKSTRLTLTFFLDST
ncbi:uncharacterized protein G2W53_035619 [Senna tora]|uniref:Uncharacterized protein n=1 Tax=Senna tora TaxID=362788 RepID=A0A834STE5_9FABA|nr:uncharacterized protein G2W53_035619 [Senna tora]